VQETNEGLYLIRRVGSAGIQIGDRVFSSSFLLSPSQYVEGLRARALPDFDESTVAAVLALEPSLVLIGTGQRQQLASPALMAAFLTRGVGIEAMDSAAAARTFNLLASEGR